MQKDNVANLVVYKRHFARIKQGFEDGEFTLECCNIFLVSLAKKITNSEPISSVDSGIGNTAQFTLFHNASEIF